MALYGSPGSCNFGQISTLDISATRIFPAHCSIPSEMQQGTHTSNTDHHYAFNGPILVLSNGYISYGPFQCIEELYLIRLTLLDPLLGNKW